jgi:hypothetical protein
MSPTAARNAFLLVCAAAATTFTALFFSWTDAEPQQEEIQRALGTQSALQPPRLSEANRLIRAFLGARGGERIAGLYYYFPEEASNGASAMPTSPRVLVPSGRVFGGNLPMLFLDPRPEAANESYRIRLWVEGREPRSYGPSERGAQWIPLTPRNEVFGADGASGRLTLFDATSEIATSSFVILAPSERAAVADFIATAQTVARGNRRAFQYLKAMVFASHRCYGDALVEIRDLLQVMPGEAVLLGAKSHLQGKLLNASN